MKMKTKRTKKMPEFTTTANPEKPLSPCTPSTPPNPPPPAAAPPPTDPPPKPKPRFRLPPELEQLAPEELDFVNDQLRSKTYSEVQEMLLTKCGIHISINKLFRYYQKLQFADQLEIAEDSSEAVEQLLNIYNGQSVDLDKAGLETIKRRALALAVSPSTKPSLLLNLVRIFTWEHRKSMDDLRKKIAADNASHRDRIAQTAERRAKCEEDRVKILDRHRAWIEKSRPHNSPAADMEKEKILKEMLGPLYVPPGSEEPLGGSYIPPVQQNQLDSAGLAIPGADRAHPPQRKRKTA
jgi:hypothetical protein